MAAKWWRYNSTSHIFEQSLDEGTSWTQPPLNASIITEGVFDIARLPPYPTVPPNIAYTDVVNTFTRRQILRPTAAGEYYGFEVQGNPSLGGGLHASVVFNEQGRAVDERKWRLNIYNGIFNIERLNDAETAVIGRPFAIQPSGDIYTAMALVTYTGVYPGRVDTTGHQTQWYLGSHASYGLWANTGLALSYHLWAVAGIFSSYVSCNYVEATAHVRAAAGLYDYARPTPIGGWAAWAVPPSYLWPSGGHNWTNATIEYYYMFIGNTAFVNCYCTGATSPHAVTAIYYLYVPFTVARMSTGTGGHVYNGTSPTLSSSLRVYGVVGTNYVEVRMANGANFPISSSLYFSFSFFMPF